MQDSKAPDFFSAQISEGRRFYLDLRPAATGRLSVLCGGCEHSTPDYEIHRTDFPYWSIEFVVRGTGLLTLRGKSYRLVAGTLFSYGPGIAHDIVTDPRDTLVKYFVDFAGGEAETLLREFAPTPGEVIQTSSPVEILSAFDDLLDNGLRHTRFSPRICSSLLELLMVKAAETQMPAGSAESTAFDTYRRCRQYLEEHALEVHTLREVADRCHIDQAYLCRLFRRFDRDSPYKRLLRLKMTHAATRLQAPGTLVKQVADELGFSDPYHFSRAFKSVFGISPARFARQRVRGEIA